MREISLLGTVRIKSSDGELPRFRSQRAMLLLGYLATERRPLTRNYLATLFWPDVAMESGKTKLRRELYNLAQLLPGCWETDRLHVHFVPSSTTSIDLDLVRQFEEEGNWAAAADLLCGDFLEGLALENNLEFETWLLAERERWQQRGVSILTSVAEELEGQGSYRRALRHAQHLLKMMPWHEKAHRHVMRLLALSDQRSAALKQFGICKQFLWDELGVKPAPETQALYERIRRSAHYSRDNIPATATPMIGREGELEMLTHLLAKPDVRLVTLTGLGGIGKTRLALELAWQQTAGQFRDGVTFVHLRPLESAQRLIPTIAQALHFPLTAADEHEARKQLLDYLQPQQMLLVLDNCEHLLPEMNIVSDILQAGSQIQILATSRERLRLGGEHVVTLQGVAVTHGQIDHAAAQLFTAAAQRVVPDFAVNERNATHVNRLCHIVNGMPLALELAAAWLDTMPAAAIVAEVETNLDFLTVDLPNIAQHHRSLRAILETTWRKLGSQTRQVFAALSVFRGSFAREAAGQVADASPQILTRLVTHSLLKFDREEDRYELHEMLHQFAAEKLASTPEFEQVITRRHFIYFNDLAQRGGAALRGGDQSYWMACLELEQNNIHQAIDWAVNHDIEAAARLTVSLHIYWYTIGLNQEAIQQCERLLPYRNRLSTTIFPWLLAVYAEALVLAGNPKESVIKAYDALRLFIEQDDAAGLTFTYFLLTTTARRMSADIDISIRLAQTGLQFAPSIGSDTYYTSLLLESSSDSLMRAGHFAEAKSQIMRGHGLCLQRDDLMSANYFLVQMSILAIMQDRRAEARRYAKRCLDNARQMKMLVTEIMVLDILCEIARADGNFDLAEQYAMDQLIIAREGNFKYYLAGAVLDVGHILMAKGSFSEALPFLREAAVRFQEIGDQVYMAQVIKDFSLWIWHANKQQPSSARWLACAVAKEKHQLLTPYMKTWLANFCADLKAGLGEETFATAWAAGEDLIVDEAMAEISLALPLEPNGIG